MLEKSVSAPTSFIARNIGCAALTLALASSSVCVSSWLLWNLKSDFVVLRGRGADGISFTRADFLGGAIISKSRYVAAPHWRGESFRSLRAASLHVTYRDARPLLGYVHYSRPEGEEETLCASEVGWPCSALGAGHWEFGRELVQTGLIDLGFWGGTYVRLPYIPLWPGALVDLALWSLLWLLLLRGPRLVRGAIRAKRGRCRSCGYLRGQVPLRACPGCGAAADLIPMRRAGP